MKKKINIESSAGAAVKQSTIANRQSLISLDFEKRAIADGYKFIAGVDEVGRGCLAGAVVAAALTPWLFEVSRLVFEVALLPALLALFLLLLRRASGKEAWGWRVAAPLGATLGLMFYAYSGARVLAPHARGELLRRAAADLVAALGQALARGRVSAGLVQRRVRPPHDLRRQAARAEQADPRRHVEAGQARLLGQLLSLDGREVGEVPRRLASAAGLLEDQGQQVGSLSGYG